ncbi:MAG: LysR family transcriptional regulator [Candidatus Rokuibacteriota bacterium]|nr:MAG: LysR family transcriptional regulator [Candidatus Rokubacteria bacterium]
MTFRQLEIVLAVARAKSFTRAAESLHVSQSTLSQHVLELERELDARLFDRLGRTVTLTEAGRLLEEHATRLVATLASARRTLDGLKGLERGSLVIGASTTPGIYVLPSIVAAFKRRYPGIDVSLHIANSQVIEERIRADEVDLGVVGGHLLQGRERCVAAGLVDELLLIVPPRHAWAKRREVAPHELASAPLLLREHGSATRMVTERTLRRAGVKFTTAMELDHTEAIKQAVMAGLGVALVSRYAVRGELATRRLCGLRVKGVPFFRHFHVVHNEARTLTASGRAFMDMLERSPGGSRPATPGSGWNHPAM